MSLKYYVPILKWKTGERMALKQLSTKHKYRIIPFIEIVDLIDADELLSHLGECFGYPVYIDTINVDAGDRELLLDIIKHFHKQNMIIFPVLYHDDIPEAANRLVGFIDKALFRIPVPEDIDGPGYSITFRQIAEWANTNNIDVDLMLDVGFVEGRRDASSHLSNLKSVILDHLLNNTFYDKLIIASTSFPETLSDISAGDIKHIERYDIKIYIKLLEDSDLAPINSRLLYSDYGVTKYTDTEIDFSLIRYSILPKVRYTTDHAYWILKGIINRLTNKTVKGFIELAAEISRSEHFYGKDFSFGDLEIYHRANGLEGKGPGNNTNWVTISANHHIAVVVEQLSKICDS